jgi:hypothetical protein
VKSFDISNTGTGIAVTLRKTERPDDFPEGGHLRTR